MNHVTEIESAGFAILDRLIADSLVDLIRDALDDESSNEATHARTRRGSTFARRNLLDKPVIRDLAYSPEVFNVVSLILRSNARAVRGILFDKTPEANWVVPWHQDLSIAVEERIEIPGFGPWSIKAGIPHVQPPDSVLRQMLTVRIHLDDCFQDNGPLRVIPNTHNKQLSPDDLQQRVDAGSVIDCCVQAGGAVLMRPMILHSSLPAKEPKRRRVVHLEYAGCDLPAGLQWHASPGRKTVC